MAVNLPDACIPPDDTDDSAEQEAREREIKRRIYRRREESEGRP